MKKQKISQEKRQRVILHTHAEALRNHAREIDLLRQEIKRLRQLIVVQSISPIVTAMITNRFK